MNTILISLIEHIKQVRPKLREGIEEIKFWCLIDSWNWYIQIVINYEVWGKLRCYDIKDKRYIVYKKDEYHWGSLWLSIIWQIDERILSLALDWYIFKEWWIYKRKNDYDFEYDDFILTLPPMHKYDKEIVDTLISLIK